MDGRQSKFTKKIRGAVNINICNHVVGGGVEGGGGVGGGGEGGGGGGGA